MSDIQLDSTGDIDITDFNMSSTYDFIESVKQRLLIRLQTFKGEYFLDTTIGIPYLQKIFVKGVSKGVVDTIFKNAIEQTPGVSRLITYTGTFNRNLRTYTSNWKAELTNGDEITGTV